MNAALNWFATHFCPPRKDAVYQFPLTEALCRNLAARQATRSPFPDTSAVDEAFAKECHRLAAERADHPAPPVPVPH